MIVSPSRRPLVQTLCLWARSATQFRQSGLFEVPSSPCGGWVLAVFYFRKSEAYGRLCAYLSASLTPPLMGCVVNGLWSGKDLAISGVSFAGYRIGSCLGPGTGARLTARGLAGGRAGGRAYVGFIMPIATQNTQRDLHVQWCRPMCQTKRTGGLVMAGWVGLAGRPAAAMPNDIASAGWRSVD